MISFDNGAPTVLDAIKWTAAKAKSSELEGPKAQNWIGAAERLWAMKRPEEPDTVEWALREVEELGRRWAIKNTDSKSETAAAYTSRMKAMLTTFLDYRRDPPNYRFPSAKTRLKKEKGETPKPPSVAQTKPTDDVDPNMRTHVFHKTHNGVPITVTMSTAANMVDMRRLAFFLMALADDFDPTAVVTPAPPAVAVPSLTE